jgi:hypothetical protein
MKKNILSVFLLILFSSFASAQIPNAGFESWTSGTPDNWSTNNLPPLVLGIIQSNDNHSGSSAASLQIVDFSTIPYPPVLTSGDFPVSQNYGSLVGYYKFNPISEKQILSIIIFLSQGTSVIGGGAIDIGAAANSYTQFTVPITTTPGMNADNAYIQIAVADTSDAGGGIGAYAIVDDLSFGGAVDVKDNNNQEAPNSFILKQNYPNPFNPSTKIEYSIPEESFVNLKVYNVIGQEVATLVNQFQKAGTYRADFNAEGMQSGIYIVKLTANKFTKSIKMTLLK